MGSNTIVGVLFQERTSQVIPPYFNGQYFSHWKVRMKTYAKSYDIKVWRVIKKGDLPKPPSNKDKTIEGQVNAKAKKNLLYNSISTEEYEKIQSCKTAKEMLDKLEVTYEGTNKVKKTRIILLVHD
ncbi:uncharacterized protein [Nicotiana tomentosiformis]|uniref:uncharacterized protein n=1 Tax=Nicotiana tomentosiformis TaxID=4098 RepID=UPI00388CCCA9